MKRLAFLLLFAGCAQASTVGSSPATERATTRIRTTDGTSVSIQHNHERGRASAYLAAPVETVWSAVLESYADLGLPVTMIDPGAHRVGTMDHRLREIGGRSVARHFSCGGGFGNDAERFDVIVTVHTQLVADGRTGTRMQLDVDASAKAPARNTFVRCRSTGTLEQELGERIQQLSTGAGS